MAIVKKTNGNLIIQTPRNSVSNITLDTDTVYITGNLTVVGNTQTIISNNTSITDNIVVLNYGESGPGVTLGTAGVAIDRGTLANVEIRWKESYQKWQITSDGSLYSNILVSGGGIVVHDDPTPVLGGNLNTDGYTIYANTNVVFGANIQINNPATLPSVAVNNATVVYADTPAGGTSGIYVLNSTAANQELVTKARAFGFSLLL